jgi:hypothetical protein
METKEKQRWKQRGGIFLNPRKNDVEKKSFRKIKQDDAPGNHCPVRSFGFEFF